MTLTLVAMTSALSYAGKCLKIDKGRDKYYTYK